ARPHGASNPCPATPVSTGAWTSDAENGSHNYTSALDSDAAQGPVMEVLSRQRTHNKRRSLVGCGAVGVEERAEGLAGRACRVVNAFADGPLDEQAGRVKA